LSRVGLQFAVLLRYRQGRPTIRRAATLELPRRSAGFGEEHAKNDIVLGLVKPVTTSGQNNERAPWSALGWSVLLAGAFAFQAAVLIVAGVRNRELINPDAVSYLRIASYYLHGRPDLAVNGYWGPLLSWIMTPILPVFADPLSAARVAVGLAGPLFLAGCVSVFRVFRLSKPAVVVGAWLAAVTSIQWSVAVITPDLLLAGLLALACSLALRPSWLASRRVQLAAGALFGIAYLAKAIALPFALLFVITLSAMELLSGRGAARTILRAATVTMVAFAVFAAPWVIILSAHYGRPMFSTSGRCAHTIVGPNDIERFHPTFTAWHRPAEGRITTWEDPSLLPYRPWSPVENLSYARHQAGLVQQNLRSAYATMAGFDILQVGLIALVSGLLFHKPWRENMRSHPWRWAAVPVACLSAWYLPVHSEGRYFWPTYAFILGAGLGMAEWLTDGVERRHRLLRPLALGIVAITFAAPAGESVVDALRGMRIAPYECAKDLDERLDAAAMRGPIASVGPQEEAGLYLAFLRNEPWYGSIVEPTPQDFEASGARLYVVDRRSPLRERMEVEWGLQNLDDRLFASKADAAACLVTVYASP
jgi:hypothetical protein